MRIKNYLPKMLLIIALGLFVSCTKDIEPETDVMDNPIQNTPTTEVTLQEAQTALEGILDDLYQQTKAEGKEKKIIDSGFTTERELTDTKAVQVYGSKSVSMHVFNFANDGYAVMSGDSRLPDLFCITEHGTLGKGDDPFPMLVDDNFLFNYFVQNADKILIPLKWNDDHTQLIAPQVQIYPIKTIEWRLRVYHQNGVCPVKWGQHDGYNKYLPLVKGKAPCVGCTAVVAAQTMACFKYPSTYKNNVFEWSRMTSAQKIKNVKYANAQDQIARLMLELGRGGNLGVSYGLTETGGSAASINNIIPTLKNFGYHSPGKLGKYDEEKVFADLKAGYPVIISGAAHKETVSFLGIRLSTTYTNCHTWLAHGIMERYRDYKNILTGKDVHQCYTYVLCNWGWEGNRDGYYLSKLFNANPLTPEYGDDTETYLGVYRGGPLSDYNITVSYPSTKSSYYFGYNLQAITGIRK